uniref:Uncharacterized protein n=1 Tax=Kalanchoe fedtschenkoi TaxID=63787 RepID=A0A7N0TXU4_KALFE
MEWYCGSGGDELVQREQHVSDSVQLSNRLIQWGICPTESFDSPNKYFVAAAKSSGEIHHSHNKFSDEVEMEFCAHERGQSSSFTVSAQTLNASGLSSTFTEDQSYPQNDESGHKDGTFIPDWNKTEADDWSESLTLDEHCGTTEVCYFSLTSEQKNKHLSTQHHPFILEQKGRASAQAQLEKVSAHAKKKGVIESVNDELSMEESLLLDFELVMNQMSEKTRYCFRDALYRLASNSERQTSNQNDNAKPNPWETTAKDESSTSRYMNTDESEAKTNVIDRTVASLMFSNMDFSVGGHMQA